MGKIAWACQAAQAVLFTLSTKSAGLQLIVQE